MSTPENIPIAPTILVVEDNDLNLRLFCDLLSAHAFTAVPVQDGRDALERARAVRPDLIVMDIQMPYVSGLDLIVALKHDAGLGTIPIVAVTAYATSDDEARIRSAGADDYISKPVTVTRFLQPCARSSDAQASASSGSVSVSTCAWANAL
jgi:two-component system cell cycle response regulator DivK